jgi:hypothetical protein
MLDFYRTQVKANPEKRRLGPGRSAPITIKYYISKAKIKLILNEVFRES